MFEQKIGILYTAVKVTLLSPKLQWQSRISGSINGTLSFQYSFKSQQQINLKANWNSKSEKTWPQDKKYLLVHAPWYFRLIWLPCTLQYTSSMSPPTLVSTIQCYGCQIVTLNERCVQGFSSLRSSSLYVYQKMLFGTTATIMHFYLVWF